MSAKKKLAYVLQGETWQGQSHYDDNTYSASTYGGNVIGVYSTREAAEAARAGGAWEQFKGVNIFEDLDEEYDEDHAWLNPQCKLSRYEILLKLGEIFGWIRLDAEKPEDEEEAEENDMLSWQGPSIPEDMTKEEFDQLKGIVREVHAYVLEVPYHG